MHIGASFCHPHLRGLNLDPLIAIKEFKNINLSWIRFGCYWDEIEEEQGKFNFSKIDTLVKFCEKNSLNVVLTVGMKALRWPEYYIPNWLSKKLQIRRFSKVKENNKILLGTTINYLEKTVNHFKKSPAVKVWQVENEPLDPSGPRWWRISPEFLEKEVALVRKLDPRRKVLINTWGNELSKRRVYRSAIKLADIVALDIYMRMPIPFLEWLHRYIGPLDSKEKIKEIANEIKSQGKKFWIAELQAEPWEPNEIAAQKKNPPSFLLKHFEDNINYAIDLNPDVLLLWGFEYWYWKKETGDLRYWRKAKAVIKKISSST